MPRTYVCAIPSAPHAPKSPLENQRVDEKPKPEPLEYVKHQPGAPVEEAEPNDIAIQKVERWPDEQRELRVPVPQPSPPFDRVRRVQPSADAARRAGWRFVLRRLECCPPQMPGSESSDIRRQRIDQVALQILDRPGDVEMLVVKAVLAPSGPGADQPQVPRGVMSAVADPAAHEHRPARDEITRHFGRIAPERGENRVPQLGSHSLVRVDVEGPRRRDRQVVD